MIAKKEARKIALKIESEDYEPTSEEIAALVEFGFMSEEEVEEKYPGQSPEETEWQVAMDKQRSEEEDPEDEVEEIEIEIPEQEEEEMTEEDSESTEVEIVEEVKKVESEEDERPAILVDGEIVEITGSVVKMEVVDSEFKNTLVDFLDTDGEMHYVTIVSKGNLWGVLYQLDSKRFGNGISELLDEEAEVNGQELIDLVVEEKKNKVIVFRCERREDGYVLWAPVSLKYQKAKVDYMYPVVREIFPDSKVEITQHSTGKHGGRMVVYLEEDSAASYKLEVNGNWLDGGHSIEITGGTQILACSNQLQLVVQNIVKDMLPKFRFGIRQAHMGRDGDELKERLMEAMSQVFMFRDIIEDSKSIQISTEEATRILDWYEYKGIVSKKTHDKCATLIGDEVIEQVPGTLWGLAMITTWEGTHSQYASGVKATLQRMGGELLCVSQAWEEFKGLVDSDLNKNLPVVLE